jgi:predicted amidohydrolase YtcJ
LLVCGALGGCAGSGDGSRGATDADRIFVGGDIVTVDASDRVVAALAIRDGRILAVGSEAEVAAHQGPATRVTDLAGGAVLPGLIDAHGHVSLLSRTAAAVNVASPPVGPAESIDDVVRILSEALEAQSLPPGSWLFGVGYDDSLLAEQRHPNRDDLDRVSTEHPIGLLHVSGHLATSNSAALERAGIDAETPDPQGGVIRHRADGEPNGVVEEVAAHLLLANLPQPTLPQRLQMLGIAQRIYAREGFTTVQDGAASADDWDLAALAATRDQLILDITSYVIANDAPKVLASGIAPGSYHSHLKLAGVKLVLDGSPQGKTAWMTQPFLVPPSGRDATYVGYPWMSDEQVQAVVDEYASRGIPMLLHANGDAAIDQALDAFERAAPARPSPDWRPVIIHAQTMRDDQLDRAVTLGAIPSFFSSHTFYWGDWHRDSVFGVERASRISPLASADARGIRFTVHNDTPIVPPDAMRLLWSSVNRITRSGAVLGEAERIPVLRAIRATTLDAAHQTFEEADKGSLEVGKRADLAILSQSPLRVPPEQIVEIDVVETVKDGATVFQQEG